MKITIPREIKSGFDVNEKEFAWIDNEKCYTGSGEQYLTWLSSQKELPNPISASGIYFYPLGLLSVKFGGQHKFASCHAHKSNACASSSNFFPLLWALEGFPEFVEGKMLPYAPILFWERVGTGTYQTYCKFFDIGLPRTWIHEEERNAVEDNFLQRYLVSTENLTTKNQSSLIPRFSINSSMVK